MKTLIVSLDNLGDCVMALGLRSALLAAEPGMSVDVWVKSYAKDVLEFAPGGVEGFCSDPFWDVSPGAGKGSFFIYGTALLRIRRARFDAALILHANWRKALSCRAAGIPSRWGVCGPQGLRFLNHPVAAVASGEHLLDAHHRLAESFLGKMAPPIACELVQNSGHGDEVRRLKSSVPGPWWVLHPFSGDDGRNWPLSSWMKLAERLAKECAGTFWIIGTRSEAGRCAAPLADLKARLGDRIVFGWDRFGGLRDLLIVLGGADRFIGHDSGPLHAACAFGVPCVGLFLHPKEEIFSPRGKGRLVALARDAMDSLEVDEVLAAASSLSGWESKASFTVFRRGGPPGRLA